MKKISLFLFTLFVASKPYAQLNQSLNSAEILQSLYKLQTLGSVLYIAAHPDDENTRLLAYFANERKFRTGYLSITRGDGGQNLIGKEQGDLLGLVRTQELLAARRTDGAEQFFTRAVDFGYSKNPEETFTIWNKDSIMADVVYTIRKFRPDVIICRFPTKPNGENHGHHTASAILALEAFDLAADPTKFPEQLKYVEVWQAKRIFWNNFNSASNNAPTPDLLKIDVGVYNPSMGKSYGEIASESRSMHKSQGFGSTRQRGSNIEYFKLLKGDSAKEDLFEGITTYWKRAKATRKPEEKVSDVESLGLLMHKCIQGYRPVSPEGSVPALIAVYLQMQLLDESDPDTRYWKRIKLKEAEKLIIACSGLWMEAFALDYIAIPGEDIFVTVQVLNRNHGRIRLTRMLSLGQSDTVMDLELKPNELYTFKHKEKLPDGFAYSNPYWLNEKHKGGFYSVRDPMLVGVPENEPEAKVFFYVSISGINFKIERPVVFKYTDPVKGEVYRPLEILPPATVNIAEKVFVFTDENPKTIHLTVKANKPNVSGTLQLKASKGWDISIKNPEFKLLNRGDEVVLEAIVTAGRHAKDGSLQAGLRMRRPEEVIMEIHKGHDANYMTINKSIQRVEYDHIPYQFILTDAEAGLVHIDLKTAGLNIAYIPGAGDDVPASLKQLGYNVTMLTDELLEVADLSKFDAIVTGVRAYNTNLRLPLIHGRLMEFVKQGGNLIVQYNTNSRVGPIQAKIGPYPFTISRERVTNENAEVRFRNAAHPVLNTPNKISTADFEGWIQERGIYFATEVDSNYVSIFSMNDPNDKPSDGSLIIAPYGKGNFVYTGLAFFRELPAGVPGAYRLFVNIISLPDNP